MQHTNCPLNPWVQGTSNESVMKEHAILIPMNTAQFRATLKGKRQQLSSSEQNACARAMTLQVCTQDFFNNSLHIAFYFPVMGELDTLPLLHLAQEAGKQCYLPVLSPDQASTLVFMPYSSETTLVKNSFNIPEPVYHPSLLFPAEDLDLVFTPLVAFDAQCYRIGMGQGYYDRSFAFLNTEKRSKQPLLCGLAYDFQEVPDCDPQSWDVRLDYVVTETRVLSAQA